MSRFRIYSGIRCPYGGAKYIETREFEDEVAARHYAHDLALHAYNQEFIDYVPDELKYEYNGFNSPEHLLDYYVMRYPDLREDDYDDEQPGRSICEDGDEVTRPR